MQTNALTTPQITVYYDKETKRINNKSVPQNAQLNVDF